MRTLLIITFLLGICSANAFDDPLFQKAQELTLENWNWVPSTTIKQDEIKNRKGELDATTEVWINHSLAEDGSIKSDFEKVFIDNQPATERQQKNFEDALKMDLIPTKKPLIDPDDIISIERIDKKRPFEDSYLVGFSFVTKYITDDEKEGEKIGTLWIDEHSGAPLLMEFTTDPLPRAVRSMENEVYYHYDKDENIWYKTKSVINIELRVLLMTKYVTSTIEFREPWQYEEAEIGRQ